MNTPVRGMIVLLIFLIGLLLTVGHLPRALPGWIGWLRPEWIVLICFFWAVELPERLGLVSVWAFGSVADVLVGDAFGTNGACLALVSFVGWKLHSRVALYSPFQQIVLMFGMCLGVLWIKAVIDNLLNDVAFTPQILVSAVCTGLWWIPMSRVLDRLKTRFDIW